MTINERDEIIRRLLEQPKKPYKMQELDVKETKGFKLKIENGEIFSPDNMDLIEEIQEFKTDNPHFDISGIEIKIIDNTIRVIVIGKNQNT